MRMGQGDSVSEKENGPLSTLLGVEEVAGASRSQETSLAHRSEPDVTPSRTTGERYTLYGAALAAAYGPSRGRVH